MKYLLYGYGVTNKAVAKYLLKKQIYFDVLVPSSEILMESDFTFLNKDDFNEKQVNDYSCLVRSPGIPFDDNIIKMFEKNNKKVISEIELAYQFNNKGKIIAITGSNGKTSTLYFLEQILNEKYKVVLAGNNDIPYISVIDQIDDSTIVLLELSSFQLENVYEFKPLVACITNLSPNHLDKTKTIERYYASKFNILRNNPVFLKNLDDINIGNCIIDNSYTFSLEYDSYYKIVNKYFYKEDVAKINIEEFKLIGNHNRYNLLVALSICDILGVDENYVQSKIKTINAPKYRNEYIASINGVRIYNDSKSTVPEATVAAIKSFDAFVHVLVGGYDKNISFEVLNTLKGVKFYAFGKAKEKIFKQVNNCLVFETLDSAFEAAFKSAKNGEIILLSPACASTDQFLSYKHRGNYFDVLIKKYVEGKQYE